MATLKQKIETEKRTREALADQGVPEPDAVEYGHTCIWLLWNEPKVVMRVDIDVDPDYDYESGTYPDAA